MPRVKTNGAKCANGTCVGVRLIGENVGVADTKDGFDPGEPSGPGTERVEMSFTKGEWSLVTGALGKAAANGISLEHPVEIPLDGATFVVAHDRTNPDYPYAYMRSDMPDTFLNFSHAEHTAFTEDVMAGDRYASENLTAAYTFSPTENA